jgi:hypothetical protein
MVCAARLTCQWLVAVGARGVRFCTPSGFLSR